MKSANLSTRKPINTDIDFIIEDINQMIENAPSDLLPVADGHAILSDVINGEYSLATAFSNLCSDYYTNGMEQRGWFGSDIDFDTDCKPSLKKLNALLILEKELS